MLYVKRFVKRTKRVMKKRKWRKSAFFLFKKRLIVSRLLALYRRPLFRNLGIWQDRRAKMVKIIQSFARKFIKDRGKSLFYLRQRRAKTYAENRGRFYKWRQFFFSAKVACFFGSFELYIF